MTGHQRKPGVARNQRLAQALGSKEGATRAWPGRPARPRSGAAALRGSTNGLVWLGAELANGAPAGGGVGGRPDLRRGQRGGRSIPANAEGGARQAAEDRSRAGGAQESVGEFAQLVRGRLWKAERRKAKKGGAGAGEAEQPAAVTPGAEKQVPRPRGARCRGHRERRPDRQRRRASAREGQAKEKRK